MKFKVGDVVTAFGLVGTVEAFSENQGSTETHIKVLFELEDGKYIFEQFLLDGRYNCLHKLPASILLRRPKTKKYKVLFKLLTETEIKE